MVAVHPEQFAAVTVAVVVGKLHPSVSRLRPTVVKPHPSADLAAAAVEGAAGLAVVAPFAVLESVRAGKPQAHPSGKLWGASWHGVLLHSPHPYSLLFDSAAEFAVPLG